MEYKTVQKHIKITPRKVRLVVDMIRGEKPVKAVKILPLVKKSAAGPLRKAIKTVIANAESQGANPDELEFKEIQVGQGRKMKRFRAGARGRAKGYEKRMSHLRIIVWDKK